MSRPRASSVKGATEASRPSSTARSATRVSSVKNSGVSSSPYSLASPSFAVRKSGAVVL